MNFKRKTAREAEWAALEKAEARFLQNAKQKKPHILNRKLEPFVPDKLKTTLDMAFYKAFELVFEKGTFIIEKTYQKEERENTYKVNAYAASLKESRKNLKVFSMHSKKSRTVNVLASGVEGVGLGVLGIGLPDIPLFTGMILKSLYETALSYGFPYDTVAEQIFILKIIRAALSAGGEASAADEEPDRMAAPLPTGGEALELEKKEQMKRTAAALSHELLYMKFLQGVPIAGVVGGIYDAVYLKRITDYGDIKYRRRFLERGSFERKN